MSTCWLPTHMLPGQDELVLYMHAFLQRVYHSSLPFCDTSFFEHLAGKSQASCGVQETELLAAGFPCVDISRAGNRAGLDGQVLSQMQWLQDSSYSCAFA